MNRNIKAAAADSSRSDGRCGRHSGGNWAPNGGTEMAFSAATSSFPGNGLVLDPAKGADALVDT